MSAAALLQRLRDAGLQADARKGKLYVTPVAKLAGELREEVITHRAALITELVDEAARNRALEEVEPPDFDEVGPIVLERHLLMRISDEGRPPEYLAYHPGWLEDLLAFAAQRRKDAEEAKRKQRERMLEKEKKSKPGGRKRKKGIDGTADIF